MRTYKETLGIIKRAAPFVNLPLTGPVTAGVNRAADDIARGLNMQSALRTAGQVPQQANSSFLSGIGSLIPFLFGMGGLGSLFNSNNMQTQPQSPPQKQVPAQQFTAPGNVQNDMKFLNSSVKSNVGRDQLQRQMDQAKAIGQKYNSMAFGLRSSKIPGML